MRNALVTVASLLLATLYVVGSPPASAAPGADATVVVKSFTLPAPDQQGTTTVLCPAGTRATGGGAAPSPPSSLTADTYRIFYSAPVDESGLASTTGAGDIPRGWQVSVGNFGPTPQTFKAFVICSANSDAVLASSQPSPGGVLDVVVQCPAGQRAIGGGVGKNTDDVIPGNMIANPLYQTGPVDSTLTFAGTQDGDVATGWRTVVETTSAYGDRFFAVCSPGSDAVVRSASYVMPMVDNAAAGSAVTCAAGTRALSGGQGNDGANDDQDRVALMGPFGSPTELNNMATGAVARAWSAYGQTSSTQPRTNRVFVLCASDPPAPPAPPADTVPPQTQLDKTPAKQTFAKKATFTFSSEAGATFTCVLDKKPAAACTSPFKATKLKVGKHKLAVTAKDAAGNADPTPATYAWKVRKKKPKRPPSGCTGECRARPRSGSMR